MNQQVKVAIIGEYDPNHYSHAATDAALGHAAAALPISLERTWVSTLSLTSAAVGGILEPFHAIWAAPGEYTRIDGALEAIRFAREHHRPFIGT